MSYNSTKDEDRIEEIFKDIFDPPVVDYLKFTANHPVVIDTDCSTLSDHLINGNEKVNKIIK